MIPGESLESFLFNILCLRSLIVIAWRFCGETVISMLSIDWWKPVTPLLLVYWDLTTEKLQNHLIIDEHYDNITSFKIKPVR